MSDSGRRVRVKICGITSAQQAIQVAEAGADAIGLVMAKSPRQVDDGKAAEIVKAIAPFVQTVAVFVNPGEDEVKKALYDLGIDMIQLHGNESPTFCKRFSTKVVKAWRVKGMDDLAQLKEYEECIRGFLLDTWDPNQAGGTGRTFDWAIGTEAVKVLSKPVILAGGLGPENIKAAIEAVRPWGVDASSSLEDAPGVKNLRKVRAFVDAVKGLKV